MTILRQQYIVGIENKSLRFMQYFIM